MLEKGGDDYAPMMALVAGAVIAIAIGLLFAPLTRRSATGFAAGGLVTWTVLFAWRAAVSRVSGANMFMIPLIVIVAPLAVGVPLALRSAAHRLEVRSCVGQPASSRLRWL